jgi:hypothetical protein
VLTALTAVVAGLATRFDQSPQPLRLEQADRIHVGMTMRSIRAQVGDPIRIVSSSANGFEKWLYQIEGGVILVSFQSGQCIHVQVIL